uniref:Nucleolysin TIAR n=1 Tax=Lygus hesperus TaxID=30085 RepID=A0A146LK12_LYGHE
MEIGNFDERSPTTLYVGNLEYSVSEELLCTLFSQIGPIRGCKIIREPGNDPYAFLDFVSHQAAATALAAMNKRVFLDREMKVNWATSPGNAPKTDISNHHHIFVGDLSPEIDTNTLREAFAPFGEISNCRIVRDPQTLKSKGYAFVSFVNKSDAENAIMAMNGQWLGNRSIRTNWSTRKPPPPKAINPKINHNKRPTFEEIFNQSSPSNTTVYCDGIQSGICEELMHEVFSKFGTITNIRVFKEKGYAFIKFTTKECAARAIEASHMTEVNGYTVKCFWGKENPGEAASSAGAVMAPSYPAMYAATGYWYAPQFAAPVQDFAQATQYAQPYGQYGYQNYLARMPGANWPPGVVGAAMQHQYNSFNPQNSDDDMSNF